ncbi:hypothetical protein ACVIGB_000859 [Bradyrhizobium sp. USDA 4341]
MQEFDHSSGEQNGTKAVEPAIGPKVSGFLENGFATVLVAVIAWCVSAFISEGGVGLDIASSLIDAAFRISCLLIVIQGISEIIGREKVLLRADWQRFGGMATGIAMMACAGAVMSTLVPVILG